MKNLTEVEKHKVQIAADLICQLSPQRRKELGKQPVGNRDEAVKFYNQAVSSVNDKGNPEHLKHAYQLFSSACLTDPTFGEAWYQCGNNNSDMNLLSAAVACWRLALDCENTVDQKSRMLVNIGWRLHSLGRTQEAVTYAQEAVELNPELEYGWLNLALIHNTLDQPETAVSCVRRAYAIKPEDPTVQFGMAMTLLFARRIEEGFKHLESRFAYKLKNFLQYPYPKWEGEAGKQVYLVADQGLGDTLSFSRFVPRACERAGYVHAYVQPELMRLFQHAFIKIPNLNLSPTGTPFPPADAWTTFVSLPSALKLNEQEIRNQQHIEAPVFSMPVNWKVPDRKFHIGIAWAGSPLNEINKHRSIPVEHFLELYRVPGIQLYSLQVTDRNKDMYDIGGMSLIRDISPYLRDVVDTTAILRDLDLVICCESALGHICALMGKECWIPYSYQGRDYRIGNLGNDMLWTPKHKVFRQGPEMSWPVVFDRIVNALQEKVWALDE